MDTFLERYADYVLRSALRIKEDDIITINTEEENLHFAKILAKRAKEITDNGSYLMILDNGKTGEMTELYSDYLIEKTPTLFVHLKSWEGYPEFDHEREEKLSARDIQRFGLLADPLVLPEPSIASVSVPLPSPEWSSFLDREEEDDELSSVMISDLLGLTEGSMKEFMNEMETVSSYDTQNLNTPKGKNVRMYTDDGMTDLSFRFLDKSEFTSGIEKTTGGRTFLPHLFTSSYFRAVDRRSANGRISITHPFVLFGKVIENLSLNFENGRVTSYTAPEEYQALFDAYFSYDEDSARLAEISIAEENNRASEVPLFGLKEWDIMRTCHITLGAPRAESMHYETENEAIDAGAAWSLCTLSLPVGSDDLEIVVTDENGDDTVIFSDGIIEDQSY